eukprot:1194374-Prorocentrum_minimum.AAC.5
MLTDSPCPPSIVRPTLPTTPISAHPPISTHPPTRQARSSSRNHSITTFVADSNVGRTVASAEGVPQRQLDLSDFKRVRQTQFIAALGDPEATSGAGAGDWGVWRVDPGPRGVELRNYEKLERQVGRQ